MTSFRPASGTRTSELHRRLLFPGLPASSPIPPLLPDASPELNAELYDFIALALRAYVHPWWSKLTRYDRDFLPQITQVLTPVVRTLAVRMQAVGFPSLLLSTLPLRLEQHYADFRQCRAKLGSAYAQGGAQSLSTLFHASQAHIGIDAEGRFESEYVRQVFELILGACLPEEDRESECERLIVREILTKVVTKDVATMLSQPWFWHRIMLEQLERFRTATKEMEMASPPTGPTPFSFNTLVIAILCLVQNISALCITLIHTYKKAAERIRTVNAQTEGKGDASVLTHYSSDILSCASVILDTRSRMTSNALFYLFDIVLAFGKGLADKCLIFAVRHQVTTEDRLLQVLQIAKQALFPNGYPGPAALIPSVEEQLLLRARLVRCAEDRVPDLVGSLLLGPTRDSRLEAISEALAPLDDPSCNAHLVLLLFDAIVLALFPEFVGSIEVRDTSVTLSDSFADDASGTLTPCIDDEAHSGRSS